MGTALDDKRAIAPLYLFDPSVYKMECTLTYFSRTDLTLGLIQEFQFTWVARYLASTGDIQPEFGLRSSQGEGCISQGTYACTIGARMLLAPGYFERTNAG